MTALTPDREAEIRARLAAATEGPWSVDGPAQCGPGDTLTVYPVEDGGTLAYVQPSWDDAEFIAHAREDIPALLAEVERLRARLAVDDDMVERGARAFYEFPTPGLSLSPLPSWDRLAAQVPDGADSYRAHLRAALDAALGTVEETK